MKLQFDRIGLPSGDLPLDAKLVATRGYKVDKEGDIRGKGTQSATSSNGCFRRLWPWKVIMLPARGPQPALKGESVMTLRLMDDVQVPQVAQRTSLARAGTISLSPEMNPYEQSQLRQPTPQLAVRAVTSTAELELTVAPQASYASLVTGSVSAPAAVNAGEFAGHARVRPDHRDGAVPSVVMAIRTAALLTPWLAVEAVSSAPTTSTGRPPLG